MRQKFTVIFAIITVFILLSSSNSIVKAQEVTKFEVVLKLEGFNSSAVSLAWNPNGYLLAGSGQGRIIIWNITNSKIYKKIPDAQMIAWSPNGRMIAFDDLNNSIRILDIYSGFEEIGVHAPQGSKVIEWSPQSNIIIAGSWSGPIIIWDWVSGTIIENGTEHSRYINSITFSPDGNYFAICAGGSNDYTIKIWETSSVQVIGTLMGHTDEIDSVSWHPNGSYLASGSEDSTIRIWNISTGETVWIKEPYRSPLYNIVSWDPTGRYLASAADGKLIIWNATTLGEVIELESSYPYLIAWHPHGTMIATTGTRIISGTENIYPILVYAEPVEKSDSDNNLIFNYYFMLIFTIIAIVAVIYAFIVLKKHRKQKENE